MKVGFSYVPRKSSPDMEMRIYTVEMFNEDVVCLSHLSHSKDNKNFSLVKRRGFHDEYIHYLPEPIKPSLKPRYDVFSLEQASKPLLKWLNDNGNPHMKVVVECDRVELVSGECSFKNDEFIKD